MKNKTRNKSKTKSVQELALLEMIKSKEDYQKLEEKEAKRYKKELGKKLTTLVNSHLQGEGGGDELMELVKKSKFISDEEYKEKKNITWDVNHDIIMRKLCEYTKTYGILPSVTRLSFEVGLSRNTVAKHLKEDYKEHEEEEFQRLKMLRDKGLLMMYSHGMNSSNMKAMSMFFNTVSKMEKHRSDSIKTQNNFIQINNIKIEESMLKNLPQEKLNLIMEIINNGSNTGSYELNPVERKKRIEELQNKLNEVKTINIEAKE